MDQVYLVSIEEHDEFVAWCKARGCLPKWDHGAVVIDTEYCFQAWIPDLCDADRVFAKLRWG